MSGVFFELAVDDFLKDKENAKDFIWFVLDAHRARHCKNSPGNNLVFHDSLKNFFYDDNNTSEEK